MAARKINNCSIIKKAVEKGIGVPVRYWYLNKCLGYCRAVNDDEPIEACKKCKYNISFELEEKDGKVHKCG